MLTPTMRMLTRKFFLQAQVETFEEEGGEEGEADTVLVWAGEAVAHAKPTRTLQDRVNKEPLRDRMQKVPLHKRRLPPLPQDRPTISNKVLESAPILAVTIATSLDILPRFAREGNA